MLVLHIISDEECCRKFLFRKKVIRSIPKRTNLCVGRKLYNVIELSKNDINDASVKKILEINRDKVLKCNDKDINEIVSEYLIDIKPYIKRAIISNVIKQMKEEGFFDSLCVKDSGFFDSSEYFTLAENLRKLSVVGCENNYLNKFRFKCYNILGLHVDTSATDFEAYLDLDNIVMNKGAFLTINGCEMLVYADGSYFDVTENVSTLLKLNVPKEYACASLYM